MTELQLLNLCTCCQTEQLVAKADAEDGLTCLHSLADVSDSSTIEVGVTGTCGHYHCIVCKCREVVVIRYAYYLEATSHEVADKAVLHTAVNDYHLLLALTVCNGLGASNGSREVDGVISLTFGLLGSIADDDLSTHHTAIAECLGDGTGVNASDTGHTFALHPSVEGLGSVPVAVLLAIVGHDESAHLYLVALEEFLQAQFLHFV